ncbi:hypothetical protein HYU92_00555 [Candidatus Curtissbacteria bacterium]|nr:hypothetical protein [Candidatus Curtissbacteria bacterium]
MKVKKWREAIKNHIDFGIIRLMTDKKDKKAEQEKLLVRANTVLGSAYAQIVGVSVTDVDITLEFVYKNPRAEIKEAQVVSRVTLPIRVGQELADTIINTIKVHEEKKKGEK